MSTGQGSGRCPMSHFPKSGKVLSCVWFLHAENEPAYFHIACKSCRHNNVGKYLIKVNQVTWGCGSVGIGAPLEKLPEGRPRHNFPCVSGWVFNFSNPKWCAEKTSCVRFRWHDPKRIHRGEEMQKTGEREARALTGVLLSVGPLYQPEHGPLMEYIFIHRPSQVKIGQQKIFDMYMENREKTKQNEISTPRVHFLCHFGKAGSLSLAHVWWEPHW